MLALLCLYVPWHMRKSPGSLCMAASSYSILSLPEQHLAAPWASAEDGSAHAHSARKG